MTISTADFPAWFLTGFYGGLVGCVVATFISLNALYTAVKRRGMTRRLIGVAVVCITLFLCLFPAFVLFHTSTSLATAARIALLCYVIFFGWLSPVSVMVFYFRSARSRPLEMNRQKEQQKQEKSSSTELHPPRYQPDVQAPFVFSAETPWGWLEYRSGNFQGQRLALKRSVIVMGRDEDCDIWLDDDMASRKHAEMAWENSTVYLTDRDSMNGTRLNGHRIRGTVLLSTNDIVEIGEQRFLFLLTEQKTVTTEQFDPLVNHKWRSSFELQGLREITNASLPLPTTKPPLNREQGQTQLQSVEQDRTAVSALHTPLLASGPRGMLLVRSGELVGKRFLLKSSSVLVGSDASCDLVVRDLGLAPQHARFVRQAQGDYVQDLSGPEGETLINDEPVREIQLLHPDDRVQFGSFHLTYLSAVQEGEEHVPPPQKVVPMNHSLSGGPMMPLRLPSRQKEV